MTRVRQPRAISRSPARPSNGVGAPPVAAAPRLIAHDDRRGINHCQRENATSSSSSSADWTAAGGGAGEEGGRGQRRSTNSPADKLAGNRREAGSTARDASPRFTRRKDSRRRKFVSPRTFRPFVSPDHPPPLPLPSPEVSQNYFVIQLFRKGQDRKRIY